MEQLLAQTPRANKGEKTKLYLPDERAKLSIKIFHAEKDMTWTSCDGLRNP